MKSFESLKNKARENEDIKNYLDSFQSQMGKEIFRLRNQKGFTQTELAKSANVTQATISRVEAGDPGIKGHTYNDILKALNSPKIKLYDEDEQAAAQA